MSKNAKEQASQKFVVQNTSNSAFYIEPPEYAEARVRMTDLVTLAKGAPAGTDILNKCLEIAEILLNKNIAYGNSALSPIQIFSKTEASDQIDVRIDDKLNRIKNGSEYPGDDTLVDLVGYLILKLVSRRGA